MAIYHCSVKTISRNAGRSSVAASAYRAGVNLTNEREGITHDYTKKRGVEHSEIMLPGNAPAEYQDRETLWNAVERSETRINSRTAREIEVALPAELDRKSQIEVLREYAQKNFIDRGMCADIALHDKGDGNPHAHIMLTTREISPEGFTTKNRDWDKRENVEQWRESWADISNRELERKGLEIRIDHRSYQEQGIEREPTIHLGSSAHQLEKRGEITERGEHNREVLARNLEYERSREAVQSMIKEMEQEKEKRPQVEEPERIAERLGGLQEKYLSLDKQINEITELRRQQGKLKDRTTRIDEKLKVINQQEKIIDQLQQQRDGLGMFNRKEKKELDKQIGNTKFAMNEKIDAFRRDFGIEPSQAKAEKEMKNENTGQQIGELPDPATLRTQQLKIELEYKQEKIHAQLHPDRDKIESLLKSRDKEPRSFDEKMKLAKLEVINKSDYKRAMEREPEIAPQIAALMPRERSRDRGHDMFLER